MFDFRASLRVRNKGASIQRSKLTVFDTKTLFRPEVAIPGQSRRSVR